MKDIERARRTVRWLAIATSASLIGLGAYTLAYGTAWYVWTLWVWWAVLAVVTVWAVVAVRRAGRM
ncbi:hypothetical protein [Nocardiopsis tropica]|uniref:Uncharacterized protein n=1 Tax=Nocardiopsis tropica TaxID=109330 RepID=A0ABU7KL90_9ACTN|nr:hypothetical protein [Nocardiopsis umidischolae]MEE2050058.1 hypothetical protein [Nocardiopsis umidischolae]